MIYCGTDIIEVERIKNACNKEFLNKVYTSLEINTSNNKCDKMKYQYLAGRFAAKEAVIKAMNDIYPNISFNEIEIFNDNSGKPHVIFNNSSINNYISTHSITLDISISHIESLAIAYCCITIK